MPIYEFYSPDTHRIYSFFSRKLWDGKSIPRCPEGDSLRMERAVSRFAVNTGREEESEEGGPDPDDPRMEAAMAEMEREMSMMDEENPDPRQMGQLMRKMADMTGEKVPPVMEEMIRRMEAGEDPEKLEEEYGDLPELEEFGAGDGEEAGGKGTLLKKLRRSRSNPDRDPQLYEMRDYLPE